MTGMVTAPRPKPRTTSHSASSHGLVLRAGEGEGDGRGGDDDEAGDGDPSAAPIVSVSRPASGRDSKAPTPCGTSMIPAVSAVAPRTSW